MTDLARQHADLVTGSTYDELLDQWTAASRALEAWHAAHAAGLSIAADLQRQDAEPPLTIKEAAARLRCSTTTVRELIRTGKLRKLDGFDRVVRIPKADVDAFSDGRERTA